MYVIFLGDFQWGKRDSKTSTSKSNWSICMILSDCCSFIPQFHPTILAPWFSFALFTAVHCWLVLLKKRERKKRRKKKKKKKQTKNPHSKQNHCRNLKRKKMSQYSCQEIMTGPRFSVLLISHHAWHLCLFLSHNRIDIRFCLNKKDYILLWEVIRERGIFALKKIRLK